MWPDCQLRAFNAKVTSSPTMVLSPCSHSCPPTLVPLFGDDEEGCGGWRTALSSQGTSSPRTWCSSAISPSSFGPSLVILGRFLPQLDPWAYYPKWAGVPRSFSPTITLTIYSYNVKKLEMIQVILEILQILTRWLKFIFFPILSCWNHI